MAGPRTDPSCPVPPVDDNLTPNDVQDTLWSQISECKSVHEGAIKCMENPSSETCAQELVSEGDTENPNPPAQSSWQRINKAMQWVTSPILGMTPLIVGATTELKEAAFKKVVGGVFDASMTAIGEVLNGVLARNITNKKSAAKIGSLLALNHRLEQVTGFPLSYLSTSLDYLYKFANPQYIPSQGELNALYMTHRMSDSQWTCYTKANGNLPDLARAVRDSSTVRPINSDLIDLYRRGIIPTEEKLTKRMRENGVLDKGHVAEFLALSEWMPQPPDLIRFMVRDVWDEKVQTKYDLKNGFEQKYPGEAAKLGKAVGLTPDTALLEWMAHWRIPSDTSLYVMLHRLRPDRPEVVEWDKLKDRVGAQQAEARLGKRPPTMTLDELKYALTINDNLPPFVDALAAISYHPITNTDASRAFELGYFDEADLLASYQDNGYTLKDSQRQVGFAVATKRRKVANSTGVWTTRKVIKQFKAGFLSRVNADRLLAPIIVDQPTRTIALDGAELEQKVETEAARVKWMKRQYLVGEFDTPELEARLVKLNVERMAIDRILVEWQQERSGRIKEPRVAMICKWHDAGYITSDEYYVRLIRLGYSNDDADRIVKLCASEAVARRAKAALAAQDRMRRDAERAMRDTQRKLQERIQQLDEGIREREEYLASLGA